jgi:hypothetical protein
MKKLYVVTMYRWGKRWNHSYLLGVFDDKIKAEKMAIEHEEYRGNKYEAEIVELDLNVSYDTYSTVEEYLFIKKLIQ